MHPKHRSEIEGCLPRRYMPDELPAVNVSLVNRPFPAPTAVRVKIERAARQFCVSAAKTSCLHARWRGDTSERKRMRFAKEGVDTLGIKRNGLSFRIKRNRNAGEFILGMRFRSVPYQCFAFAQCPPNRRRRFRYGLQEVPYRDRPNDHVICESMTERRIDVANS